MNNILKYLGIFIILSIIALIVLYILYWISWPIKYTLSNNGDDLNNLEFYINDSRILFDDKILKKGEKKIINLNGDNINFRTKKPFTRDQVTSTVVYIPSTNNNIDVTVSKLPKNSIIKLYEDISGKKILNENPGKNWKTPGYYIITFNDGIPLFNL